jgi:hypothetical protein
VTLAGGVSLTEDDVPPPQAARIIDAINTVSHRVNVRVLVSSDKALIPKFIVVSLTGGFSGVHWCNVSSADRLTNSRVLPWRKSLG